VREHLAVRLAKLVGDRQLEFAQSHTATLDEMGGVTVPVASIRPSGYSTQRKSAGVLTRFVVDVGEASGVELELSSSSARTHGGLSCLTLMPG
jgi:hypothetical protein